MGAKNPRDVLSDKSSSVKGTVDVIRLETPKQMYNGGHFSGSKKKFPVHLFPDQFVHGGIAFRRTNFSADRRGK